MIWRLIYDFLQIIAKTRQKKKQIQTSIIGNITLCIQFNKLQS